MMILCVALLVGVAIPFGLFYLIGMLDTTIRSRHDIEKKHQRPVPG